MNNNEPFAPMAPMPPEIEKALYGRSSSQPVERPGYASPVNPWAKKVDGDGRIDFIADDAEEIALAAPIEHIKKLFTPAAPARITPRLSDLRALPMEDPDEVGFCSPIKKLFYADPKSITPAPAKNIHKAAADESWDAPLNKTSQPLTYRRRLDADGTIWNEGFDAAGVLKSAMVIISEETE